MDSPITLAAPLAQTAGMPAPKNLTAAAQQFEALLMGVLLKAARGDQNGWLGTGDETGDATAASLAEEQFAQALSSSGGLGLSAQIRAELSGGHP